jgi:protein-tyrosine phosphatase
MVDIHCHILPGIDDGSPSLEVSCAMAEMAIADGVTHVIGTPHASPEHAFSVARNLALRDALQAKFAGQLTLATGCDFHLSYDNLQDIRTDAFRYTLNQKSYLLVEFADYSIPPTMDQALHELQLAGLKPIVTHPERNPLIRAQPEPLAAAGMIRAGDGAIAAGALGRVREGRGERLAGRGRGAFRGQRRAQYDVASAEAAGDVRDDRQGARRGCGAGAAGGKSAGGVRGPGAAVGAAAGG